MTKPETVVLKCPSCGKFLGEVGNFYRGRCCGYEIIVSDLRPDRLTTQDRSPRMAPTTS